MARVTRATESAVLPHTTMARVNRAAQHRTVDQCGKNEEEKCKYLQFMCEYQKRESIEEEEKKFLNPII
jgi:hypothetical protein